MQSFEISLLLNSYYMVEQTIIKKNRHMYNGMEVCGTYKFRE